MKTKQGSGKRKRRFIESERIGHVEAYLSSEESMSAYCRRTGIGLSTLHRWLADHKGDSGPEPVSQIIPVKVQPHEQSKLQSSSSMIVKLDCGIEVKAGVESFGYLYRQIKLIAQEGL